jgi:hypothetical protein
MNIEFYNAFWTFIGTNDDFQDDISDITGIDPKNLKDGDLLHTICVAKRM